VEIIDEKSAEAKSAEDLKKSLKDKSEVGCLHRVDNLQYRKCLK
jgi:hypothetical protein